MKRQLHPLSMLVKDLGHCRGSAAILAGAHLFLVLPGSRSVPNCLGILFGWSFAFILSLNRGAADPLHYQAQDEKEPVYEDPMEDSPPHLKTQRTPGLEVEAYVGVGGARDLSLATSIVISIHNRTEEVISGTLELDAMLGIKEDFAARLHSQDISVPAATHVRFHLCKALALTTLRMRLRRGNTNLWQQAYKVAYSKDSFVKTTSRLNLNILAVHPMRQMPAFPRNDTDEINDQGKIRSDSIFPRKRKLDCYVTEAWGLPVSAVPLIAFRALLFSGGGEAYELTQTQLKALSDYLLWGGCLVLTQENTALWESIRMNLPQEAVLVSPGPSDNDFVELPVGMGKLVLVNENLFHRSPRTEQLLEKLAEFFQQQREPSFPSYISPSNEAGRDLSPNATASFFLIAGMFLFYALLTGPVIWLFLRNAQRNTLKWYVLVTVGIFCLISLLLGSGMPCHKGDLEWLTVTELTSQGGIQWGLLTLISAGGRNHILELEGHRTSQWLLPNNTRAIQRYPYSYGSPLEYSSNLNFDPVGKGSLGQKQQIPIAPWGSRLLLANAFWPEGRSLDVRTRYADGALEVRIVNTLPVSLTKTRLVWGAWTKGNRGGSQKENHDYYQECILGDLSANGGYLENTIPVSLTNYCFQLSYWDDLVSLLNLENQPGHARFWLPQVNVRGRLIAYLVASVESSPELAFGESSFEANRGTHLVLQPIPIECIPADDELFRELEEKATKTEEPYYSGAGMQIGPLVKSQTK